MASLIISETEFPCLDDRKLSSRSYLGLGSFLPACFMHSMNYLAWVEYRAFEGQALCAFYSLRHQVDYQI